MACSARPCGDGRRPQGAAHCRGDVPCASSQSHAADPACQVTLRAIFHPTDSDPDCGDHASVACTFSPGRVAHPSSGPRRWWTRSGPLDRCPLCSAWPSWKRWRPAAASRAAGRPTPRRGRRCWVPWRLWGGPCLGCFPILQVLLLSWHGVAVYRTLNSLCDRDCCTHHAVHRPRRRSCCSTHARGSPLRRGPASSPPRGPGHGALRLL